MVTDLGIIDVGLKPVPEVRRWLAISECMWGERERERESFRKHDAVVYFTHLMYMNPRALM